MIVDEGYRETGIGVEVALFDVFKEDLRSGAENKGMEVSCKVLFCLKILDEPKGKVGCWFGNQLACQCKGNVPQKIRPVLRAFDDNFFILKHVHDVF